MNSRKFALKKMIQLEAKVVCNKTINDKFRHCAFEAPDIAKSARPGQFVNIRVSPGTDPLLRRPLSIHRVDGKNIELLYEVLGPATELLSRKQPGEGLDVIGPLGQGFEILDTQCPILAGGGMGVAPLLFLAERLAENLGYVLLGARTKKGLLCVNEFKRLGWNVVISTDDGSSGFKGRVTDLLQDVLRQATSDKRTAIYACGPRPMLKELSRISAVHKIRTQVSLEEHMACGIGACIGCVVDTRFGRRRVCKEGPVFYGDEIIWG